MNIFIYQIGSIIERDGHSCGIRCWTAGGGEVGKIYVGSAQRIVIARIDGSADVVSVATHGRDGIRNSIFLIITKVHGVVLDPILPEKLRIARWCYVAYDGTMIAHSDHSSDLN